MITQELVEVIGSVDVALQIVNGDRIISQTQAELLVDYFRVDASLFA